MDVKIPGGVSTYVVDLRGERCVVSVSHCGSDEARYAHSFNLGSHLDMKQRRKYGKRRIFRLYFARSYTLMILIIV